ncbi:hypothetical protein EJ110_NYTH36213 [Nymphaea thermarum]|nr:hypothetical protein EJ110_NYTH36213 [Nymphaea thermarum]
MVPSRRAKMDLFFSTYQNGELVKETLLVQSQEMDYGPEWRYITAGSDPKCELLFRHSSVQRGHFEFAIHKDTQEVWITKTSHPGRLSVAGREVKYLTWERVYPGEAIQVGYVNRCFMIKERPSPFTKKQSEPRVESTTDSGDEEENSSKSIKDSRDSNSEDGSLESPMDVILNIYESEVCTRRIRLVRGTNWDQSPEWIYFKVGRESYCQVVIPHPSMSDWHLEIVIEKDTRKIRIMKITETGKLSVAGKEMEPFSREQVQPGELISMGDLSLRIIMTEQRVPEATVPQEFDAESSDESEEETSTESDSDSSTNSSSNKGKGILGAPPVCIINTNNPRDNKGILGPAQANRATWPLKRVQPGTQKEKQGQNYQNNSDGEIDPRIDTSSKQGVQHIGSHKGLLPLPTKTREQETLRESNPRRPNSKVDEQKEINSPGHPSTGNKMLLPPPTSENQPKEGGTDHILFESPSKKAQMELQQWVTHELSSQSAKLNRARGRRLALVKQQARSEVVAASKNKGSSKTGCKQRSQPLNIQKILEEELLAEMDGILLESEEDKESNIEERHTLPDSTRGKRRITYQGLALGTWTSHGVITDPRAIQLTGRREARGLDSFLLSGMVDGKRSTRVQAKDRRRDGLSPRARAVGRGAKIGPLSEYDSACRETPGCRHEFRWRGRCRVATAPGRRASGWLSHARRKDADEDEAAMERAGQGRQCLVLTKVAVDVDSELGRLARWRTRGDTDGQDEDQGNLPGSAMAKVGELQVRRRLGSASFARIPNLPLMNLNKNKREEGQNSPRPPETMAVAGISSGDRISPLFRRGSELTI